LSWNLLQGRGRDKAFAGHGTGRAYTVPSFAWLHFFSGYHHIVEYYDSYSATLGSLSSSRMLISSSSVIKSRETWQDSLGLASACVIAAQRRPRV
jgi:hypothetical protein